MIAKIFYENKIRELKNLRNIQIGEAMKDLIFEKIKNYYAGDLDKAIDDLLWDTEKFSLPRLNSFIGKHRARRMEEEAAQQSKKDKGMAENFFHPEDPGGCKRQLCRGCPWLDRCKVRAYEWMKSIAVVYNSPKGQAKQKEEDAIRYMKKEFMGGI